MKICVYAVAFGATLMTCAASVTPAQAENCKPLTLLATVPMTTSEDGRQLFVPVQINGQEKRLLLDTGADASMLSEEAATAFNLKTVDAPVKLYDVTGSYTDKLATTSMKLGRIAFDHVQFMVSPRLNSANESDVIGLLGTNVLGKFDLSIDPTNKKLDILSPDHCPDDVVYWPATGYSRIPFDTSASAHIRIDVTLDGKPIKAIIDTGTTNSTLLSTTAKSMFGITLGAADTPRSGDLNGRKDLATYTHSFQTLNFDGVAVNKPSIELIPDTLSNAMTYTATGSNISRKMGADAEVLIGMNILRHMHFYVAYKEKAFYFTPATAASPATTK